MSRRSICRPRTLCVLAMLPLSACTSSTEVLGSTDAGRHDGNMDASPVGTDADSSRDAASADGRADAHWEDADFPPTPVPDGGTGAADAGPDAGGECSATAPWPPDGPSGSGSLEWSVSLRGPSNYETFYDVAADAEGNIYVVGDYHGAAMLGDEPLPEATSDENGIIASYGSDGSFRWMRVLEGTSMVMAERVHVLPDGHVIVAGTGRGSFDVGGETFASAGLSDTFVAVYAAEDGSHVASRAFGGPNNDYPGLLAMDDTGAIVLTGTSGGNDEVDFGGGPRTPPGDSEGFGFVVGYEAPSLAHRFDRLLDVPGRASIIGDSIYWAGRLDDELHIDGRTLRASDPRSFRFDGFVLELDTGGGTLVRSRLYGSFSDVRGFGPVVSSGEELAVGVRLGDGADLGTGAVEACEAKLGVLLVGSDLEPRALRLHADSLDGRIGFTVTAGGDSLLGFGTLGGASPIRLGDEHYRGRDAGDLDAFVAELLPDESIGWMRRWGGAEVETVRQVIAPDDSHLLAIGISQTSVDLGGGTIANLGGNDAHLMKIAR